MKSKKGSTSRGTKASRKPAERPQPPSGLFPIVGIGASAGGLEAMTALLRALPSNPGCSIVLVQHLDPTHESALAVLLSRVTAMPVLEARHNARIEPDHVYLIPPNRLMGIAARRLKLLPRPRTRESYTAIDFFFKSLAGHEGDRAIGVLLSGSSGSDGTQGLLAIKAAGGITLTQDEKSAKYPAMPAAAVAAGCVDAVLSPEELARELLRLAGLGHLPPESERPAVLPSEEKAFGDILATLRRQMGVDFTLYKHATLRRRIQRRIVLQKLFSMADYASFVRNHTAEVRELFNDILIHVTGFFRDASVFQMIRRRIVPRLLKNRGAEDPVRVWVPGCSTGEEVYSLAMLLLETVTEKKLHQTVQIFGTDINEAALEKARAGVYPEAISADVSVERLRRFFLKTEGGYRVNKTLREMCIFARHNVVTDPPFSNLDFISCRNMLIYLGPQLQRKALPLFHYALKPSGLLLLGASETVGGAADLFSLVDKKSKVYAKRASLHRPPLTFGTQPSGPKNKPGPAPAPAPSGVLPEITEIQKQADHIVLSQRSPAGVVVNRQLDVLQFRGRAGDYLELKHGAATLNLLKMAREGLSLPLRALVSRALKRNARVREDGLQLGDRTVGIEAVPFQVGDGRERYCLVLFEAAPRALDRPARGAKRPRAAAEGETVARLRKELAAARESLRALIEEQEPASEQLRLANEEILSSNEELQSINEELETAKEELQSTNEELSTLNDELENRNAELEHVNNDLQNLLASVNIPVVMVGPDLKIRRFTSVAEKVFNLIPTDIGRPITDFNLRIIVPSLDRLLVEVMDTLQARDLEVKDAGGHWWSLRIRPYKTTDNKIDGAVIALVDVDVLKTGMERIRRAKEFSEAIVNTARQPLVVLDRNLLVQSANDAFYRAFGVDPAETINHRIYELGNGQWNIPKLRTLLEDILPHNTRFDNFEVDHTFPGVGRRRMILNARRLLQPDDTTELILLAIEDVTGT